jgi:hypothetical protein
MNIGLGVEENYIEQLKEWMPGDPLPSVLPRITGPTGVMTTAAGAAGTAGETYFPMRTASTAAKYLPYVLIAGVAITLYFLWQRTKDGY